MDILARVPVSSSRDVEAIRLSQTDLTKVPSTWRPVLAARAKPGITRLQFALAGMNAHINRDLPAGIVRAFEVVVGDRLNGQARRDDFDRVNGVLDALEADVKPEFSVGLVGVVDVLAGQADDLLAMWNVRAARATARPWPARADVGGDARSTGLTIPAIRSRQRVEYS